MTLIDNDAKFDSELSSPFARLTHKFEIFWIEFITQSLTLSDDSFKSPENDWPVETVDYWKGQISGLISKVTCDISLR